MRWHTWPRIINGTEHSRYRGTGGKGLPITCAASLVIRTAGVVRNVHLTFRTTPPVGRAREPSCSTWTPPTAQTSSANSTKRRAFEQVRARFEAYLKQHHTDAEINKLHEALGYVDGQPPKDVLDRYKDYLYFGQPAGSLTEAAVGFLNSLDERGELPGILKGDHEGASLTMEMSQQAFSSAYPISRTFYLSKRSDLSLYYYLVFRASEDSAWKLQKAWRTGPDGRVIKEYPVP